MKRSQIRGHVRSKYVEVSISRVMDITYCRTPDNARALLDQEG
jgi:hypothetical protein